MRARGGDVTTMAKSKKADDSDFDWSENEEDLDEALKRELERPIATHSTRNQDTANRFAAEFDQKLQLAVENAVNSAENKLQDALKRAMISAAMEAATEVKKQLLKKGMLPSIDEAPNEE